MKSPLLATPLDGFLLLFVVTAGMGYWVSYNREMALVKFLVILVAVAIYYGIVQIPKSALPHVATALTVLGAFVSVYFLFTHDWRIVPGGIGFVDRVGQWWMDVRPFSGKMGLHVNIIAGILATLFPFAISSTVQAPEFQKRNVVLSIIIVLGMFMTASRGAWIALLLGLSVWAWWHISGKRKQVFVAGCVAIGALALVTVLVRPSIFLAVANRLPGVANGSSRLELYGNTLALAPDYLLTGGGLYSFAGLFSQYVLIVPNQFLTYAHNVYLDVLLEQGVVGLFAWLGIYAGTFIQLTSTLLGRKTGQFSAKMSSLGWATFASLLVILVHGLVDDALYGNAGTPILFIVPAIAIALSHSEQSRTAHHAPRYWAFTLIPTLALVLFVFVSPTGRAVWYANLGAVAMAQVELADFPTNEWDEGQNLERYDEALAYFRRSLAKNSDNQTAHYRLGLVAMVYRNFDIAVKKLEMASMSGGKNAGIQKALAYSYLWNHQPDQAQTLLVQLPESRHELRNYVGWWQNQNRDDLAHLAEQMQVEISSIIQP